MTARQFATCRYKVYVGLKMFCWGWDFYTGHLRYFIIKKQKVNEQYFFIIIFKKQDSAIPVLRCICINYQLPFA